MVCEYGGMGQGGGGGGGVGRKPEIRHYKIEDMLGCTGE